MSTSPSLVVIVVCASVGGLVVVAALARLILAVHRRRRLKPIPLPPVQPLAHHREKYFPSLNTPDERQQTTLSSSPWSSPQPSLRTNSSAPLLSPHLNDMSRQSSFHTDESGVTQYYPATSSSPDLTPPTPAFASGSTSRNSSNVQLVQSDSSIISGAEKSEDTSTAPRSAEYPPLPRKRGHSASPSASSLSRRSRPRPQSMTPSESSGFTSYTSRTQTNRSMRSTRSTSTIRGAPHGPYSQVEIVIPTPLAPTLYPKSFDIHGNKQEVYEGGEWTDELSMATTTPLSMSDAWLPIPTRDESTVAGSRERKKNRTSNPESGAVGHRSSKSSPIATSRLSTSTSAPSPSSSSPTSSPDAPRPPPVPRIPSMYNTSNPSTFAPLTGTESDSRGRSKVDPRLESKNDLWPLHPQTSRSRSTSRPRTLRKAMPVS